MIIPPGFAPALMPAAIAATQSASLCFAAAGAKARVEVERLRREYASLPSSDLSRSADIKRLALLRSSDQSARDWLSKPAPNCTLSTLNSNLNDPAVKSFVDFMLATDRWDQTALRAILDRIGWPIISKYGKEADQAAFLVVQHATNDPGLQRAVLAKLKTLTARKQTTGENYALLFDRVAEGEGRPQLFGSQGICHGTLWKPDPISNPATVDKRRLNLGMPKLAECAAAVSKSYCQP